MQEQQVAEAVRRLEEVPVAEVTLNVVVAQGETLGTILNQKPEPGTGDEETLTVTLDVAGAPMEDLKGKDVADAINALADLNLRLAGTSTESSASVAQLHVIRTDPAGGTPITVGTPVALVVSSGPRAGNGGSTRPGNFTIEIDPTVLERLRQQPVIPLPTNPMMPDPRMGIDRMIIEGNRLILNQ